MSFSSETRAVVTGAGSGLGRAFSIELAKRGARVIAADLNLAAAEETVRMLGLPADRAYGVKCDVSSPEAVEAVAKMADERWGGADLLVNNAGVAVAGPMEMIPLEDWRWIVSVNLFGVVHGCKAFVPRFKARRSGHVLNVASSAGLISAPEMAPYNVTKAGVVALSETLSAELRPYGVGVSVLCPTFFKTSIVDSGRTYGTLGDAKNLATTMMERSKIQADGVAKIALAAAERNELYVVPMADGRWMWRLKRLAPGFFQSALVPRAMAMAKKRLLATS